MGVGSECTAPPTSAATPRQADGGEEPGRVGEALRRARQHRGWSLREVERRTGRPNAYLSQVERGVIRKPDPVILWQLADLYDLNFNLLMQWSGLGNTDHDDPLDDATTGTLIRQLMNFTPRQRRRALGLLEDMAREDRD
jgi:transcriptional regulator with XRE-family HTH domain